MYHDYDHLIFDPVIFSAQAIVFFVAFVESIPTCGDDRGVNGSGLVNLTLTEGVDVTLYCIVTYAGKWAPKLTWSGMYKPENNDVMLSEEPENDQMTKLTLYMQFTPSRQHQGVLCTVYLEELPEGYYPHDQGNPVSGDLQSPEQNYTCGMAFNVQCEYFK